MYTFSHDQFGAEHASNLVSLPQMQDRWLVCGHDLQTPTMNQLQVRIVDMIVSLSLTCLGQGEREQRASIKRKQSGGVVLN